MAAVKDGDHFSQKYFSDVILVVVFAEAAKLIDLFEIWWKTHSHE